MKTSRSEASLKTIDDYFIVYIIDWKYFYSKSNMLDHIGSFKFIAQLSIVVPCSNPRNNCNLIRSMFVFGDPLGLLHKHGSITLVLELIWVSCVNRHNGSVYMELTNQWAFGAKLRSECIWPAFSQPQQTYKNVLLWIFIGNERFPAFICYVVSSDQLNIFGFNLEMNLLDANLSCPYISAWYIHLAHLSEGQLS